MKKNYLIFTLLLLTTYLKSQIPKIDEILKMRNEKIEKVDSLLTAYGWEFEKADTATGKIEMYDLIYTFKQNENKLTCPRILLKSNDKNMILNVICVKLYDKYSSNSFIKRLKELKFVNTDSYVKNGILKKVYKTKTNAVLVNVGKDDFFPNNSYTAFTFYQREIFDLIK